jgi:hypothetical protein
MILWGKENIKQGSIQHTTIGTLAGSVFFRKTGIYEISYGVGATGVAQGAAVYVTGRLDSNGNISQGTPINQAFSWQSKTTVFLGSDDGVYNSKSFMTIVPADSSMQLYVNMRNSGNSGRLVPTGTDVAVRWVTDVAP